MVAVFGSSFPATGSSVSNTGLVGPSTSDDSYPATVS